MAYITASVPCVSFQPALSSSPNYVMIMNGEGCTSEVGMQGGEQSITLNRQCFEDGLMTTVHQLLHTLGFTHEHSRTLVLTIFDVYLNLGTDIIVIWHNVCNVELSVSDLQWVSHSAIMSLFNDGMSFFI